MVFEFAPKLKEACSLVCKLRAIFRNKKLTKDTAKEKLHAWYKEVSAAESLNSKMKGFRSELRGVRDLPFFLYRCTMIFG